MSSDTILLHDGRTLQVHSADQCYDDLSCAIHNPSNHTMRQWPLDWQNGMLVRVCPLHPGSPAHPDPDALAFADRTYNEWRRYHECCGCCETAPFDPPSGTRPTKTIILRNSARCRFCKEDVESKSRHEFRSCSCGRTVVDGGHAYRRGSVSDWATDTSITIEIDMSNGEIQREHKYDL